jgi:hypothetical protein
VVLKARIIFQKALKSFLAFRRVILELRMAGCNVYGKICSKYLSRFLVPLTPYEIMIGGFFM